MKETYEGSDRAAHFLFTLYGHGWATLTLNSNDRTYSARVTNVAPNEPVYDTILASIALLNGAPKVAISYFDEPGECRLRIERKNENLHLSVLWFHDGTPFFPRDEWTHDGVQWVFTGDESPWPSCQHDFYATVPMLAFLRDVAISMNAILEQFGLENFREQWSADFPATEFECFTDLLRNAAYLNKGMHASGGKHGT